MWAILKKFNMSKTKVVKTPFAQHFKVSKFLQYLKCTSDIDILYSKYTCNGEVKGFVDSNYTYDLDR